MNARSKAREFRRPREAGATVVEFALVVVVLLALLIGILELGRALYLYNTVQEATRNVAREAVVSLTSVSSQTSFREANGLFGRASLPGGGEVTAANIEVRYVMGDGSISASAPVDQLTNCQDRNASTCVRFVRARISGAGVNGFLLFPGSPADSGDFIFPLPESTVTMPAESMGCGSTGCP